MRADLCNVGQRVVWASLADRLARTGRPYDATPMYGTVTDLSFTMDPDGGLVPSAKVLWDGVVGEMGWHSVSELERAYDGTEVQA